MRALFGLVLAGGESRRMGRDKALLRYRKIPQWQYVYRLLLPFCERVYVSRQNNSELLREGVPILLDHGDIRGPAAGLLSGYRHNPTVGWLGIACDLPFCGSDDVKKLVEERMPGRAATCFVHSDGTPEPCFAIWEPSGLETLAASAASPRKVLEQRGACQHVRPDSARALTNVNSGSEIDELLVTQLCNPLPLFI